MHTGFNYTHTRDVLVACGNGRLVGVELMDQLADTDGVFVNREVARVERERGEECGGTMGVWVH